MSNWEGACGGRKCGGLTISLVITFPTKPAEVAPKWLKSSIFGFKVNLAESAHFTVVCSDLEAQSLDKGSTHFIRVSETKM